jgi:hypothetical protein
VTDQSRKGVDLYVPPDRPPPGTSVEVVPDPASPQGTIGEQMRHKLRTPAGQAVYKLRKAIVAPGCGQSKEGRGFRRFSFRGLVPGAAEWTVICLTHTLLKLLRAGAGPRVT